ncbi:MAG TPA: hypothetical protein VNK95_05085 [Caldilineaceae bacterium]|nr:hypothetical protein [Caldilineaceae bacterium]
MIVLAGLFGLVSLALPLAGGVAASAQDETELAIEARIFESDRTGELHPAGLAFSPGAGEFWVLEAGAPASSPSGVSNLIRLTPAEDRTGTVAIEATIADAINMAFDSRANRLLLFDATSQELIEIKARADGRLAPATLARHPAQRLDLQRPQGMTVDPQSGQLFILDGAGPRLVRIEPDADGRLDRAMSSIVDLQQTGLVDPRGLALDPATGHLHVLHPAEQTLYELTQSGQVAATRSLPEFTVGALHGMVFAPSGDLTDDPSQQHLYLAHRPAQQSLGSNPGAPTAQPGALPPGQITELSFVKPVAASAAISFQVSLVQMIDLSALTPPSPDPSGIAYIGAHNTLLVSDGEVEETTDGITHFQGANVWELTLNGSIVHTANLSTVAPTVVPISNEPAGVAWDPLTGNYFISDDGARRVYTLQPGADGLLGTADDTWTSFSTRPAGNLDPEEVAFDAARRRLFVADGTNQEIYQYTLTGELVGQFDVERYGVVDPESVEVHPEQGTLFVMSSHRSSQLIIETTIEGDLLQTMDISAANPRSAAGLTYAPASDGSNAMHFYIVDRGVDNNTNPTFVDGKLYEVTAPGPDNPPPDPPPPEVDPEETPSYGVYLPLISR